MRNEGSGAARQVRRQSGLVDGQRAICRKKRKEMRETKGE